VTAKGPTPKQRILMYAQIFGSENGRWVLKDMIRSYQLRSSFVEGDSHKTAFNEGARSVLLKIYAILKSASDPDFLKQFEESPDE
jgi:hypothetical protein